MGLAASRQEAFWEACGFGNVHRARQFLEEGDINVNWVSYTNDCSAIHVASQGKREIVELLIEHNCDVNVRDNRGSLPLHHAAMKGHTDIVKILLDAGSVVDTQDKNGWTALHKAAYWSHLDVVKILLEKGCDVHIKNQDERTALLECARSRQENEEQLGDIASLLIKAGSDMDSKSSDWGEADLTGLMYAAFHNHPGVATALIEAGCDLNAVGTTFWSALHWAADRGNEELVYILLEAGIDPCLRDMKGDMAVDRAHSDTIREVLKTATELHKELTMVKTCPVLKVVQESKPVSTFKPSCDAGFKSKSFLPKDWKPRQEVKDLIKERKTRLAAMNNHKYKQDTATSETDASSSTPCSIISQNGCEKLEPILTNSSKTETDDSHENSSQIAQADNNVESQAVLSTGSSSLTRSEVTESITEALLASESGTSNEADVTAEKEKVSADTPIRLGVTNTEDGEVLSTGCESDSKAVRLGDGMTAESATTDKEMVSSAAGIKSTLVSDAENEIIGDKSALSISHNTLENSELENQQGGTNFSDKVMNDESH